MTKQWLLFVSALSILLPIFTIFICDLKRLNSNILRTVVCFCFFENDLATRKNEIYNCAKNTKSRDIFVRGWRFIVNDLELVNKIALFNWCNLQGTQFYFDFVNFIHNPAPYTYVYCIEMNEIVKRVPFNWMQQRFYKQKHSPLKWNEREKCTRSFFLFCLIQFFFALSTSRYALQSVN